MKLCVKKVYCPTCHKLVSCKEQSAPTGMRFVCAKCGKAIWNKEGLQWKHATKVA